MRRNRQIQREERIASALLCRDFNCTGGRGLDDQGIVRQRGAIERLPGDEATARIALERQSERIGADDLRPCGRARVAQRHLKAVDRSCIGQRQRQSRRRRLNQTQYDRARFPRCKWIDAQLVVVAQCRLQQARIDTTAHDVLEHLLGACLLHRHCVTQLAVDVERKAADDLTACERKLQLAFKNSRVRIEKLHLHARLRHAR